MKYSFLLSIIIVVTTALMGCAARKELAAARLHNRQLQNDSAGMAAQISELRTQNSGLRNDLGNLNTKIANLSQAYGEKQNQLTTNRQTVEAQQQRLRLLQQLLDAQQRKSEEIRQKMEDALAGFSSNELTVTQKDGKVYVIMQENLLFPSGSAVVNQKGVGALSKLASVLNLNPDMQLNVEGHTDSIPIRTRFQDNWELSTARANSIVRVLVDQYHVSPMNVIASGHSRYAPVATNSTPEGRAQNRRTDIIISPKLDELYRLISQQ